MITFEMAADEFGTVDLFTVLTDLKDVVCVTVAEVVEDENGAGEPAEVTDVGDGTIDHWPALSTCGHEGR